MAKVGAQRAAELTGVSKSTIQRAMTAGKLSFELDSHQRRLVDVSELERVFGLKSQSDANTENSQVNAPASMQLELEKARHALELEKVRMELRLAQEQLDNANAQIEDLKIQRDLWQKQAQQILITSQYSQKQSEERINEMQQREAARQAAMQRRAGVPASSAQAQPIRPQTTTQKPQQAEVVNRPIQGNATSSANAGQQAPIFRTVQPGNQNRSASEPAQKQSLFASLFGGNKKRTGTN
ncbi:MAG TPA: entry exclusion 1 domain-containing protein [Alphaproteobacteria bacterium]